MDLPRIIAHRGSPRAAPENTLASFRRAAEEGARWVEFDAALTVDSRVIVFHDDTLERTSDGIGTVSQTPLEVISALDAGSWFGTAFRGEPIPTLEETLEVLASLGLGFNMELKTDPGREVDLAAIALPIAKDCWPQAAPRPLISSFSRQAVAAAKETAPEWPRGLIFDLLPEDWEQAATALTLTTLNGNHQHLNRERVAAMRDAGYGVLAYTVNDPARAAELFSWGVAGVFTDIPGEMIRALG